MTWATAADIASVVSAGVAAAGLVSLFILWSQWRSEKAKAQQDQDDAKREQQMLSARDIGADLTAALDTLLESRSRLWADALDRPPADRVARAILATAAIRLTGVGLAKLSDAIHQAKRLEHRGRLDATLNLAKMVVPLVAKEDANLAAHMGAFDARYAKLEADTKAEVIKRELSRPEEDALAFLSIDGLVQTADVFMKLNDEVRRMNDRATELVSAIREAQGDA